MKRPVLIDERLRVTWGKRVRLRRRTLQMTQIDLARDSCLSQSLISKIESGDHPAISVQQMLSIAAALDSQVEELFEWTPGLAEIRRRELMKSVA